MYWLNGVPEKQLSLASCISFFGDGFFTTVRLRNGIIELLDWHLDRLFIAGKRLLFDNLDLAILRRELDVVLEYGKDGVIRIVIIRSTSEETGYSFRKDIEPFRIIFFSSVIKDYKTWHRDGVRLAQSSIRISRNQLLAGIKHLNRLEQILIRENLNNQRVADEFLVLDTEGNLVECCAANIFWRIGDDIFTPSLTYSGVSGVMRRWVLELLSKLGYSVQEVVTTPDVLRQADEVFISNSLLPVAPVRSIGTYRYISRIIYDLLISHYMTL